MNSSASKATEVLRFARHQELCTAVPLPELDWSNKEDISGNLEQLRRSAEEVAWSAIYWYLRKRRSKKIWSVLLRRASYALLIIGAALPLMRIFGQQLENYLARLLFGIPVQDVGGLSAELALLFLGLAGGFHLIDRMIGASTGWIRYMATAMRIHEQLVSFRFRWDSLTAGITSGEAPGNLSTEQLQQQLQEQKFGLVRNFWMEVLAAVREETTSWAAEFSDSIAEFEKQLPTGPITRLSSHR